MSLHWQKLASVCCRPAIRPLVTFSSALNQTNMMDFLCEYGTFSPAETLHFTLLDMLSAQHECITVIFDSICCALGVNTVFESPPPCGDPHHCYIHVKNFIDTHCTDTNSEHVVLLCVQSHSLCFISWNSFWICRLFSC